MTHSDRGNSTGPHIIYEINVQGQIDESWSGWFSGMSIHTRDGNPPLTTLVGPVVDQVALRGILDRIWNLNLTLISVRSVGAASAARLEQSARSETRGSDYAVTHKSHDEF